MQLIPQYVARVKRSVTRDQAQPLKGSLSINHLHTILRKHFP